MNKPSQAAISLEKALAFISAADAQIDTVIIERSASHGEKDFWQSQKRRLKAVLNDVMARIPKANSRDIIRQDLSDPYGVDALFTLWAQMNTEGRDELERYANEMIGTDKKQAA